MPERKMIEREEFIPSGATLDELIAEYGEHATISISWDNEPIVVFVTPETDKEYKDRVRREEREKLRRERAQERQEERDRKELARLLKKYGSP